MAQQPAPQILKLEEQVSQKIADIDPANLSPFQTMFLTDDTQSDAASLSPFKTPNLKDDTQPNAANISPFKTTSLDDDAQSHSSRLSLPPAKNQRTKVFHSRRSSDSRIAHVIKDVEGGTQYLQQLRQLHAARRKLQAEETSLVARRRPTTWSNTLAEVDDCIGTILEESANVQLEAFEIDLSRSQSARSRMSELTSHEDGNHRISRNLQEPTTILDEPKGRSGIPLRFEAALNAYFRGECSTGQPEPEHLPPKLEPELSPLRLRSLSSPAGEPTSYSASERNDERGLVRIPARSATMRGSKQLLSSDELHIFPALQRDSTLHSSESSQGYALSDIEVSRDSYISEPETHPAYRSHSYLSVKSQVLAESSSKNDHNKLSPQNKVPTDSASDKDHSDTSDTSDSNHQPPPLPLSGTPTKQIRPTYNSPSAQRILDQFPATPSTPTSGTSTIRKSKSASPANSLLNLLDSKKPRPSISSPVSTPPITPTRPSHSKSAPPRPPTPLNFSLPLLPPPTATSAPLPTPLPCTSPTSSSPLSTQPLSPTPTPSTSPHSSSTPSTPAHPPTPSSPATPSTHAPTPIPPSHPPGESTHQTLLLDALMGAPKGQMTILGQREHAATLLPPRHFLRSKTSFSVIDDEEPKSRFSSVTIESGEVRSLWSGNGSRNGYGRRRGGRWWGLGVGRELGRIVGWGD